MGKAPKKRRGGFFSWLILLAVLWLMARYLRFLFF
jgi:hypothetical protein